MAKGMEAAVAAPAGGPSLAEGAALATLGGLAALGERETWLLQAELEAQRHFIQMRISSQAQLLLVDVRQAFLAGAWASVIVLGQAAIEATLRDLQFLDHKSSACELFFGQEDLERIRHLRNELVHPQQPGSPSKVWSVSGTDIAAAHSSLEDAARLAYPLALEAMYAHAERF
ncbi:MAG TPA: hypothetical protein VGM81_22320 [Burkholderiaceae bacterium]|jgi:hypothetical protein